MSGPGQQGIASSGMGNSDPWAASNAFSQPSSVPDSGNVANSGMGNMSMNARAPWMPQMQNMAMPQQQNNGMNFTGGSQNFDESTGQYRPGTGPAYMQQQPMAASGIQTGAQSPPNLASFSQGDLYRNVGNNAGLSTALQGMDPNYHQNVNAYNSGSGFASQADFLNNLNSSQQAGKQLNDMYNTGYDPTQGITSIDQMKKLGLWG